MRTETIGYVYHTSRDGKNKLVTWKANGMTALYRRIRVESDGTPIYRFVKYLDRSVKGGL